MSHRAIAAFIWIGVDVVLAALAAPAIVLVFLPGLIRAWSRRDIAYMVDILAPNVMLMIVPGGIAAAGYLFIASRVSRG